MAKTKTNIQDMTELIDKIRGTTPEDKIKEGVDIIIKADAEKAKAKAEEDKKKLESVKKAEEDNKKKAAEEETKKKAEAKKKKLTGDKGEEKTGEDSEIDANAKVKTLTENMEKMAKEIEGLKKQKNYRTKPPKADTVDELSDFIKQNSQVLSGDYETWV